MNQFSPLFLVLGSLEDILRRLKYGFIDWASQNAFSGTLLASKKFYFLPSGTRRHLLWSFNFRFLYFYKWYLEKFLSESIIYQCDFLLNRRFVVSSIIDCKTGDLFYICLCQNLICFGEISFIMVLLSTRQKVSLRLALVYVGFSDLIKKCTFWVFLKFKF